MRSKRDAGVIVAPKVLDVGSDERTLVGGRGRAGRARCTRARRGHASSTASIGITPSPSGTETGPAAGSSHAPAQSFRWRISIAGASRRAAAATSSPTRRALAVSKQTRRSSPDLLEQLLDLLGGEIAVVLEREPKVVVAGGGRRPRGGGRRPARAAARDAPGPPATMRITGSPSAAARGEPGEEARRARRRARRTRGPRARPTRARARHPLPRRDTRPARSTRDRRGSSSAGERSRARACAPRRRRRAIRAGTAVQRRRLAGPDLAEQAGGRRSCRRRPGRHQSALVGWSRAAVCAPAPASAALSRLHPRRAIPPPTAGHRGRARDASGATGAPATASSLDGGERRVLERARRRSRRAGTPSSSRRRWKRRGLPAVTPDLLRRTAVVRATSRRARRRPRRCSTRPDAAGSTRS